MTITDEMLYAAAPEAAERLLDSLPGREDCGHEFSAEFTERMRPLLKRRHRRWRRLLLAAAVAAVALSVAIGVGAQQKADCRLYWSQSDGVLRYTVQVEHETVLNFQKITLGEVPAGYTLEQETLAEGEGSSKYTLRYQTEDGKNSITVSQMTQQLYTGLAAGAYTGTEVKIGGQAGLLIEDPDAAWKLLLWTDGPYILTLEGTALSREEVTRIAENIRW